jgi:hypothetical protein
MPGLLELLLANDHAHVSEDIETVHVEEQTGTPPVATDYGTQQLLPPRVRLSTVQDLIPRITPEKIEFVLDQLPKRGPAWAREYMDRIEGFAHWPKRVQQKVLGAKAAQHTQEVGE